MHEALSFYNTNTTLSRSNDKTCHVCANGKKFATLLNREALCNVVSGEVRSLTETKWCVCVCVCGV